MNSSRTLNPAVALLTARLAFGVAISVSAILLLGSTVARATSASWNGATSSDWAVSTNWLGNPAVVPGTGDTATFGGLGNGNTTISLGAGVTIGSVGYQAGATSYTIGSGAVGSQVLTLNHGSFFGLTESAINNQLVNAALVLGTTAGTGTYQFWPEGNRTLTLAGPVTGGTGGVAGTKTITVGLNGDNGNVAFSGVIGGGSGTIAITKTGTSTLTLSGANTFTGALTVSQGTLSIPTINNASTAGPLGNSATPVSLTGTLIYTGATASSSKRFTILGSTFQIDSAATELTISGIIDGATGLLKKTGPGTLTLAGVNTYGSETLITNGTLKVSGSGRLGATTSYLAFTSGGKLDLGGTDQTVGEMVSYDGPGNIVNNGGGASVLTFSSGGFVGSIFDNDNATAGTVALTKVGTGSAGVSLISGSNYSGAVLVTNGYFGVNTPDSLGSATTGTTVSSGATLNIQNTNIAVEPITISGVGETGNAGALEGENAIYGGLLKLNAASTVATSSYGFGGTFDITNPGTIIGATFLLTLAGEGTGSIASIIGTTSGGITKNGTGKWTLSGANTYTGTTTINAGILNIQHANALGASTSNDTTITAGATLQIEGGITTPAAEGVTVRGVGAAGATGALQNVSGNNTWSGTVTLGANSTISSDAGTLSLTNATPINDLFDLTLTGEGDGLIATVIAIGANTLTKIGSGVWTLSALNTYTAKTFIQDGTLEINTLMNVSGGSSSLGAPTTAANGTIDIGGFFTTGTLRFTGTVDAVSNRVINMTGTGITGGTMLDSSSATNNRMFFTSALTATGDLGDRMLTLTGTSTGNNEIGGAIPDSAGFKTSVTKTGSGKWILSSATNSYTGNTSVSGGTLVITNAFLANAADVNLTTGATLNLTFAGSDTIDQLRIDGVIQSPGTWGSLASSATYKTTLITGSGMLNVGSGAAQPPYASWAGSYPLSGANYPFDADPDDDDIDNGLEWILGGSPLANSAGVLPQVSSNATNLFLTLSRNDASESSSTLIAQWGTDLAAWTDVPVGSTSSGPNPNGIIITITENGAAPDTVVVTIPRSNGSLGALFARLRMTMP